MSTPDARPAVPACRAPWVAMDFDAFGNVQACCANALYPLGNVVESSLREIWDGPRAQRLRRMVAATGFGDGCSVCRHRVEVSGGDVPLDYYDQFDVIDEASWPSLLSFSLHNACNLQCIMCGADSSSSIRTRREGLAPLDHVYGESFFAELEPFLRRCVAVDFIGGEPFLVREHDRVWALLAEVNPGAKVSVTTNGTVYNDRVERLLELADTDVVVSVDGVTKETFERIRVGSDFESVVANLERFHRYCTRRGTGLYLSFSLVRQNWFEMGGVMLWAESLGAHVTVQTVIEREFGVQRLDTRALRAVVEALEAESADVAPRLNLNRDIWLREVGRLRRELDARTSEGSNDLAQTLVMEPPDGGNRRRVTERIVAAPTHAARRGASSRVDPVVAARQELLDWCPDTSLLEISIGTGGRIASMDGSWERFGFATVDLSRSSTIADLLERIEYGAGAEMWIGEERTDGARVLHTLWFGRHTRDKVGLIVRTIAVRQGARVVVVAALDDRMQRAHTAVAGLTGSATDPAGVAVAAPASRRAR